MEGVFKNGGVDETLFIISFTRFVYPLATHNSLPLPNRTNQSYCLFQKKKSVLLQLKQWPTTSQ